MGLDEPERICSKCSKDIGEERAMKAKDKLYHADSWYLPISYIQSIMVPVQTI